MLVNFNKVQKKFSWLRVPNLMFYVILCTGIVYFAKMALKINSKTMDVFSVFEFNKDLILKGEVWRIFTYVFLLPKINFVLAFIYLYILNFISNSLENHWGASKLTFYYIFGFLCTTAAGFVTGSTNIVFLNLSLIFVFVAIYPDMNLTFFSMINIRAHWLGVINTCLFLVKLIISIVNFNPSNLLAEFVAVAMFIIFFGPKYFINIFNSLKQIMKGQRI